MSKKPYQIEKGIPLPRATNAVYPFAQMEVGDSFTFEPEKYNTIRRCASYYAGGHGCKFSVSSVHNRCWRRA